MRSITKITFGSLLSVLTIFSGVATAQVQNLGPLDVGQSYQFDCGATQPNSIVQETFDWRFFGESSWRAGFESYIGFLKKTRITNSTSQRKYRINGFAYSARDETAAQRSASDVVFRCRFRYSWGQTITVTTNVRLKGGNAFSADDDTIDQNEPLTLQHGYNPVSIMSPGSTTFLEWRYLGESFKNINTYPDLVRQRAFPNTTVGKIVDIEPESDRDLRGRFTYSLNPEDQMEESIELIKYSM